MTSTTNEDAIDTGNDEVIGVPTEAGSEVAAAALKDQVIHSVRWSYVGTLLPQLVRPFFTIVIARLLRPADYGIFGLANGLIELAEKTQDMGLSAAIIKCGGDDLKDSLNVAFWLNCLFGVVAAGAMCVFAPSIADVFHEPRLTPVLRILSIALVMYAVSSVQVALLRREFQFKSLARVTISVGIVPLLVAVCLAALGFGYWSFVISTLVLATLWMAISWTASPWRPQISFNRRVAVQLVGFAAFAAVETMVPVLIKVVDNAILGYALGTTELGLFTFALTIATVCVNFLVQPVQTVAYSALCRLADSPNEFKRAFCDGTAFVSAVTIPACVGLCITAPVLVPILFGEKWIPAAPIVAVLALMPGLSFTLAFTAGAFRAVGRPDLTPKISLAGLILSIPISLFAVQQGLMAFVLARSAIGFVVMAVTIGAVVKVLHVPWSFYWHATNKPILAAVMMASCTYPLCRWFEGRQMSFLEASFVCVGIVATGSIAYIVCMAVVDRALVRKMTSIGRRLTGLGVT